jgi:release factor glutamine methyltransferase
MLPEKDTILYVLTKSQEYLKSSGIPSPRLDAELLLSEVLGIERIRLYSNFDRKLTEEEKDKYRVFIKERATCKPVAYIIQKKAFYKSNFYVNESVLIPRPETEELVDWVISDTSDGDFEILDLGTGSGCIGISLQQSRPYWKVFISDLSADALEVAQKNSREILGKELIFFHSDLFASIPETQKFDRIVSNPPYIPIQEKPQIMKDVLDFEPHLALFIEDSENFFLNFLQQAKERLKPQGKIYLEIHPDFSKKIQEISKDLHYSSCTIKQDFSNKDRMVRIEL